MRVAIVNDLETAIAVLRHALEETRGMELAWIARDGKEGLQKCLEDPPDLVLMDLVMPVMNGVEATRRIMTQAPCAILIVTFSVGTNASMVFEAMGYGALDAVNTPVWAPDQTITGLEVIQHKLYMIERLLGKGQRHRVQLPEQPESVVGKSTRALPSLCLIGASTGGPKAIATLLAALPPDFPHGVVVVQHVDEFFAEGFAHWLGEGCAIPVRVAEEGQPVTGGKVFVAGKEKHLLLQPDFTFHYAGAPFTTPYRPSVDVLFSSMAHHWPKPGVAVLLTGMGRDGAQGMKLLKDKGWTTLAQDQATSIVYGMPRAAKELGAVDQVLPLGEIGTTIIACLDQVRRLS